VLEAGSSIQVRNPKDTKLTLTKVSIPAEFYLNQNFPNPFNPLTTILFGLPEKQKVTVKVFDVLGREVSTILDNMEEKAGNHRIEWDAAKYSTGVYFLRLQAGPYTDVKKMMLIK
jgi:hypothetical protein